MARTRRTLALIIICLPILVTVITAFRVRDLPTKSNEKCEECDVKIGQKLHSVRTESDKHSRYEELKKAVRVKQQQIHQKSSDDKSAHQFSIASDEDDDDDEDVVNSQKLATGFAIIQGSAKAIKIDKSAEAKSKVHDKKVTLKLNYDDNDDSDDDDDADDNDDENEIETKTKSIQSMRDKELSAKTDKLESHVPIKIQVKKVQTVNELNDDDDSDDDEFDEDDYDGMENVGELFKILNNQQKPKIAKKTKKDSKEKPFLSSPNKAVIDEDDDDDDDDEDITLINKPLSKLKTSPSSREKNIEKKVDLIHKVSKNIDSKVHDNSIKDKKDINKVEISITDKKIPEKPKVKLNKDMEKEVHDVSKDKPKESEKNTEKKIDKKDRNGHTVELKHSESEEKNKAPVKEKHHTEKEAEKIKTIKNDESKVKADKTLPERAEQPKVEKKPNQEPNKKEDKPKATDVYKSFEAIKERAHEFHEENAHKKSSKSSEEKICDNKEASKSDSHLNHVTDALHRRNLLKSEFEDFYAFFPTFAPNFSRIANPECRRHGQILLRQLRGTKLWALNMLDASAKIPSGVLQGNGIQLGDYDQCLSSRARVKLDSGSVVKVQGKYCLALVDVKAEHPELEVPVHLAQAKNLVRSKIDDPGHFVPRFSTLSWGVCVPSACSSGDVELLLRDAIKHYQKRSGLLLRVKVDKADCHIQEEGWEVWLELPTVLTLSFYGVVVLLVLVATAQDYFSRGSPEEERESDEKAECDQKEEDKEDKVEEPSNRSDSFLGSFSLYYTIGKLVTPGGDDEISCIHGIRGLATLALLVAHKFLPVGVMPYTNRVKITDTVSSPLWSWCRAGWMYTDCFLLLSGTLTAHRISAHSAAAWRLFSRYLRLTPALLAVVLFYAYVWELVSSGPMWGTFVTKNAQVCRDGWWWNVLYVQNYFGFEDMCAPQTHQLALDMQLTILGGILVWVLQEMGGWTRLLVPGLHLVAAYSRYTTVRDHRLTLLAYHGVSVSQLYRTARLSYTSVLHRCTSYLVGISLGLALREPANMGKFRLTVGWLTSIALWSAVWWAGFDSGSLQYRYSANVAAQYAAAAPVAAALAVAWVIYAVHNGSTNFMSRFLCCRALVLVSRLSYSLYLTQFIVFITNIGTVKTSTEFTLMSLFDVQEISAILLSSIILTLTFITPMQNLHKVFSFTWKSETTEVKEEIENQEEKPENAELEEGKSETEEPKELAETTPVRKTLLAHREVLEEIPEAEIEFESQREINDGLDEILEEEEEEMMGDGEEPIEEEPNDDDDLEIIDEEEGGEDEWEERGPSRLENQRRSYTRDDQQDLQEWEWTANGRHGGQNYRYYR